MSAIPQGAASFTGPDVGQTHLLEERDRIGQWERWCSCSSRRSCLAGNASWHDDGAIVCFGVSQARARLAATVSGRRR